MRQKLFTSVSGGLRLLQRFLLTPRVRKRNSVKVGMRSIAVIITFSYSDKNLPVLHHMLKILPYRPNAHDIPAERVPNVLALLPENF